MAVLRKTLTSTNVGPPWIAFVEGSPLLAAAHALLWTTWNRKNLYNPSVGAATLWVRVSIFLTRKHSYPLPAQITLEIVSLS